MDPLFQKTSATFDEGGTGGLLLNHLQLRDDSSEIILDSNTVIMNIDHHDEVPSSQTQRMNKVVKIKELKGNKTRRLLNKIEFTGNYH